MIDTHALVSLMGRK